MVGEETRSARNGDGANKSDLDTDDTNTDDRPNCVGCNSDADTDVDIDVYDTNKDVRPNCGGLNEFNLKVGSNSDADVGVDANTGADGDAMDDDVDKDKRENDD